MTRIELVANDQLLQVTVSPKISSGEVNTVRIHVDFSEDWNGLVKNAVFYTSYNSRDIYEIIMTNDECIVPYEVMTKSGTLYIGIRGVNSEANEVKTTSLVKLKILEGAPTGNSTEVEPTPDVYQQLLTAYGKTDSAIAKEVADRKSAISTEKAERQSAISTLNTSLTQKISSENGTYSEGTYVKLDGIAYDEENGKLLLTKAGADTPIPFSISSGIDLTKAEYAIGVIANANGVYLAHTVENGTFQTSTNGTEISTTHIKIYAYGITNIVVVPKTKGKYFVYAQTSDIPSRVYSNEIKEVENPNTMFLNAGTSSYETVFVMYLGE